MSRCPRVMISAYASGSGKTTVTCGILQALKNRGVDVAACKCGPDYIDPMFHKSAIGIFSKNIDLFFEQQEQCISLFKKHAEGRDIVVTEGVMGYYDGLSMTSASASSYEVAKTLKMPVILVVNAKGMALSVIAVLKGMIEYRDNSNIQGVILNNVSKMVFDSIAPVIESELGIKALGYLPHDEDITIDSRHLGLVTPENISDIKNRLEKLSETVEETIDIDELLRIANKAPELEDDDKYNFRIEADIKKYKQTLKEKNFSPRIAVAMDEAFCFYYQDNLDILQEFGCTLVPFSPIRDKALPENIDGLILGGGYPELYAEELSSNKSMLNSIKAALEDNLPCHAECGGYMYLHNTMEDRQKKKFKMVGFIDEDTFKCDKLVRFGYITLSSNEANDFIMKGEEIKAHEFHYWDSTNNGTVARAVKPSGKREWKCCHQKKNTFMGYPHLFYYSNPKFVRRFVDKCVNVTVKTQA